MSPQETSPPVVRGARAPLLFFSLSLGRESHRAKVGNKANKPAERRQWSQQNNTKAKILPAWQGYCCLLSLSFKHGKQEKSEPVHRRAPQDFFKGDLVSFLFSTSPPFPPPAFWAVVPLGELRKKRQKGQRTNAARSFLYKFSNHEALGSTVQFKPREKRRKKKKRAPPPPHNLKKPLFGCLHNTLPAVVSQSCYRPL